MAINPNNPNDPLAMLISQSLGLTPQPAPVAPQMPPEEPIQDLSGQPVPVETAPSTDLWDAQQRIIEDAQATPLPEETPEALQPLPAEPDPVAEAPVAQPEQPTLMDMYQGAAQRGQEAQAQYQGALGAEQEALQAGKVAAERAAEMQAGIDEQQARDDAELAEAAAEAERASTVKYQTQLGRLQAREAEIANTPLDSERLWKSKSAPQQIAGIFAAMASGFLSPYNNGRNFFLESFEKQVDRDIEMQRADRQQKLQALGNQKLGLKDQLAFDRQQDIYDLGTKKAMLNSGISKLRGIQTQLQGTAQGAAVDQQIAQLEQKSAAIEEQQALKLQDHYGDMINKEKRLAFDRTKLAQQERLAMAKRGRGGGGYKPEPKQPDQVMIWSGATGRAYPASELKRNEEKYVVRGFSFALPDGRTGNRAYLPEEGEGKDKLQNKLKGRNKIRGAGLKFIQVAKELRDKYGITGSLTAQVKDKFGIQDKDWARIQQAQQGLIDGYRVGGGFGASFTEGEEKILKGSVFGGDPDKLFSSTNLDTLIEVVGSGLDSRDDVLRADLSVLLGPEIDPKSIEFPGGRDKVLTQSGTDRADAQAVALAKPVVSDMEKNIIGHNKADKKKDKAGFKKSQNDAVADLRRMDEEVRQTMKRGVDTDEGEGSRVGQFDAKDVKDALAAYDRIYSTSKDPVVRAQAFTLRANLRKDLKKFEKESAEGKPFWQRMGDDFKKATRQ